MEKKYYELWGYEAFQRETFLVSTYENKEEAEAVLAAANAEALRQDIALRDRYWIVESTIEDINERELREQKRLEQLEKEWDYSEGRLKDYASRLSERFMEIIERDRQSLLSEEITILKETNPHKDDCYAFLQINYNKNRKSTQVIIEFKNGSGIKFSGKFMEIDKIKSSIEIYSELIETFENCILKEKNRKK